MTPYLVVILAAGLAVLGWLIRQPLKSLDKRVSRIESFIDQWALIAKERVSRK